MCFLSDDFIQPGGKDVAWDTRVYDLFVSHIHRILSQEHLVLMDPNSGQLYPRGMGRDPKGWTIFSHMTSCLLSISPAVNSVRGFA